MDQLLGFIVLTSPLFLIVIWVPVCIALAVWVGKKFIKTRLPLKIVVGTVFFLVLLVLPFADEIAGTIYFNHLCETEAGAKVYQTIELPAEYWDEDGTPTFYDLKNGNFYLDWDELVNAKFTKTNRMLNVIEMRSTLRDKRSGEMVGERVLFGFRGGWIANNFSTAPSSANCGQSVESTLREYAELFKPSNKIGGE